MIIWATWWAWMAVPGGWLFAVLAHGLHNAMVSFGAPLCLLAVLADWTGLFFLIGIAGWALRREKQWLREHLREEVENGLISPAHYETVCSVPRRVRAMRKARRQGRAASTARFYTQLAKLAFLKAHPNRKGDPAAYREALAQLRHEIARLAPNAESDA